MIENARVRLIDPAMDEKYGVLTVLNSKGDTVLCFVGDPYNMKIESFPRSSLKYAD